MAEVVSLVASIVTFVDVASKVISRLREYHSLSKDAHEGFQNVSTQLPLMVDIMRRIEKGCRDGSVSVEAQNSLLQIVRESLRQVSILQDLMNKVLPVPLDSSLQRRRKAIRYLRDRKRIAAITASIEDHKSTLTLHFSQISYDLQQHNKNLIYLSWLKPLELSHILETRVEGTCDWIWGEVYFKDWYTASNKPVNERLLRICGPQGCGKSALASSIFQDLRNKGSHALFFRFSGIHRDRQDLNSLARTCLGQSLQYLSHQLVAPIMDRLMLRDPFGSPEIMRAFEEALKSMSDTIFCVIDGVDESTESGSGILKWALSLLESMEHLRIVLVGRPHSFQTIVGADSRLIEIDPTSNSSDIAKFIDAEVDTVLALSSSSLRDSVTQTLRERSDGIFLWVKLMVGNIRDAATKGDMMNRLRHSPRGLEQIYTSIFQSLTKTLTQSQLERAHKMFSFVVAARRSLKVDELRYMFALQSPGDLEDNLPIDTKAMIPGICGDLVCIVEDRVQLIHTSIKDFLIRPSEEWDSDCAAASFRVDLDETHQIFSDSCLRYVMMDLEQVFPMETEADIKLIEGERPFINYSVCYAVSHLVETGPLTTINEDRIKQFVDSEQSDLLLEYATLLTILDPLEMFLDELHVALSILLSDESIKDKWNRKMAKYIAKRMQVLNHPENILSGIEETGFPVNLQDEDKELSERTRPVDLSKHSPNNEAALVAQIMDQIRDCNTLPLAGKTAGFLGLVSRLASSRHLITDPLKLLLKMLLQASNNIPVYVLRAIGIFYEHLGKEDDALEVFRAALKKVETPDSFVKFLILEDIGHILEGKLQWEAAEAVYKQSLAGKTELFGPYHLHTGFALQKLSNVLHELYKYDERESILRLLLKAHQKNFGLGHRTTINVLGQIGHTLYDQGKYASAEEMHRRSLHESLQAFGQEHEKVISSMKNIATCLHNQRKYKEAEIMFRQAWSGAERVFGKFDVHTFGIAGSVGATLGRQGKYAEAVEICRQATNGIADILGQYNDKTLFQEAELAYNLASLNDFSLMKEMYIHAVNVMHEMQSSSKMPDNGTIVWISNVGSAHMIKGDYERAEQIRRFVLEREEKKLSQFPSHPRIQSSLRLLCSCLIALEKYEEAIPLERRWVDRRTEIAGEDNIKTWKARARLGKTLVNAGSLEEGERTIREALVSMRVVEPLDEEFLAIVLDVGGLLSRKHRPEAAEFIFRLGMDTLSPWKQDRRKAWLCLVNVGITLSHQDRLDDAETIYKRAFQEAKDYPDYDWSLPRHWLLKSWRQRGRIANDSSDAASDTKSEIEEPRRRNSWSGFKPEPHGIPNNWDRASIV